MKLLLTAFDPFGGSSINPALEAVKLVADRIGDVEIVKLEVPTVFGESITTVVDRMEAVRPDAVLCIGQAGGRYDLTVERVAINVDDARIPDNAGQQPIDIPIFEDRSRCVRPCKQQSYRLPAHWQSLSIFCLSRRYRYNSTYRLPHSRHRNPSLHNCWNHSSLFRCRNKDGHLHSG